MEASNANNVAQSWGNVIATQIQTEEDKPNEPLSEEEREALQNSFLNDVTQYLLVEVVAVLTRLIDEFDKRKHNTFEMFTVDLNKQFSGVTREGYAGMIPAHVALFGHIDGNKGYQVRKRKMFEQFGHRDAFERVNDYLAEHKFHPFQEDDPTQICMMCISTPVEKNFEVRKEREQEMKRYWSSWGWQGRYRGSNNSVFVITQMRSNPKGYVNLWHGTTKAEISSDVDVGSKVLDLSQFQKSVDSTSQGWNRQIKVKDTRTRTPHSEEARQPFHIDPQRQLELNALADE